MCVFTNSERSLPNARLLAAGLVAAATLLVLVPGAQAVHAGYDLGVAPDVTADLDAPFEITLARETERTDGDYVADQLFVANRFIVELDAPGLAVDADRTRQTETPPGWEITGFPDASTVVFETSPLAIEGMDTPFRLPSETADHPFRVFVSREDPSIQETGISWTVTVRMCASDATGLTCFHFSGDSEDNGDRHTLTSALDRVAPTSELELRGSTDDAGAFEGRADARVIARDATSGVAEVQYQVDDGPVRTAKGRSSPTLALDEPGIHAIRYRAVDAVGNAEAWTEERFRVVPGPSDLLRIDAPARAEAGEAFDVRVRLLTDEGRPAEFARADVMLEDPAGDVLASPQTLRTVGGEAVFEDLAARRAGTLRLVASAPAYGETRTQVQILPDAPADLHIDAAVTEISADRTNPVAFSATAQDEWGNEVPVRPADVTWSVHPDAGAFSGAELAPSGDAGTYNVTARYGDSGPTATIPFTITVGAPAAVTVDIDPGTQVPAGGAIEARATVFDAHGNEVPSAPVSWSVEGDRAHLSTTQGSVVTVRADAVGTYEITATSGDARATREVTFEHRSYHAGLPDGISTTSGGQTPLLPGPGMVAAAAAVGAAALLWGRRRR